MRFLILALLTIPSFSALAAPEEYSLQVRASLEKCVPSSQYPGSVECTEHGAKEAETVRFKLKDCLKEEEHQGGGACRGLWTKKVSVDGVAYTVFVWVTKFLNPANEGYRIDTRISRDTAELTWTQQKLDLPARAPNLAGPTAITAPRVVLADQDGRARIYNASVILAPVF